MSDLFVFKIGGGILEDDQKFSNFTEEFCNSSANRILVHGGGKTATKIAERLGIEAPLIDGRRITNDDMIDVATMVYAGLVNKKIVARIQSLGQKSVGVCGLDANISLAQKRQ